MNYDQHKKIFSDSILVYIEEFNKIEGTVIFDFIDSDEHSSFRNLLDENVGSYSPSMVQLNNYKGRTIQENTIYAIRPKTIQSWREQELINDNILNSYLIAYIIDVAKTEENIFNESVTLSKRFGSFGFRNFRINASEKLNISFDSRGPIAVVVRDVGQGNWNEIRFNDEVKIVYDAGAPMGASRIAVAKITGNRNNVYPASKPILVLSHWDKDHYHSLIGMSDVELKNNFSAFICRDDAPNLTSKILLKRVKNAVGAVNTFEIPADPRVARGGPTTFRPLTILTKQVVLYNSQKHKNRNISGLILTVKTSKGSIVLPGDAHYEQISRDILPHLNYRHRHNLVVPHHGGKAGKYSYKIPSLATANQAIVSVGANSYGHPLSNYITLLNQSGFRVRLTKIANNDIRIEL